MSAPLVIAPTTRVGALLSAYPELEPVLCGVAPEFARLKNPVLRRTVAKVATLAQAARIARIDVRDLVLALRRAAGQESITEESARAPEAGPASSDDDLDGATLPAWVHARSVAAGIDADAILGGGQHPLATVERQAQTLAPDQLLSLRSSFVPAPLIDLLRQQGFEVHTRTLGPSEYETLIARP